jgi:hypothetical protein
MNRKKIWQAIEIDLRAEKRVSPNYPDHVAAQAGKVNVEAGNLMFNCMEYKYSKGKELKAHRKKEMEKSAIRTAVEAIRFLENLK